ncbi:hypothetical protein A2U01_0082366 [Trifolium medium]|uniref:Uncharacterized protein n=1 Tax=Trifolium medium TaxID=97028 RepID=A0A392TLV8_9FABA|nr:hypothetical protein [Trifolium medium]
MFIERLFVLRSSYVAETCSTICCDRCCLLFYFLRQRRCYEEYLMNAVTSATFAAPRVEFAPRGVKTLKCTIIGVDQECFV